MANPLYGKGIPLATNFDLGAKKALDSRTTVNTYSELNEHVNKGRAYSGLIVYVIDEDTNYQFDGVEWKEFGRGSGSSSYIVNTYQEIPFITECAIGGLIYVVSDENKNGEPNLYIITEVEEKEDGTIVPLTYITLSTFTKNQIPTLVYDVSMPEGKKIYISKDDNLILKFSFSSENFGDGQYKVYSNGSLIKSVSAPKGTVLINIGKMPAAGTYSIEISATDYFGVPAERNLVFEVVVGGLELSSTFDQTLLSAIYEVGDDIVVPYVANVSDRTQTIKMHFKLNHEELGEQVFTVDTGMANIVSGWIAEGLTKSGTYSLEIQAYTGASIDDTTEGSFISNKLKYSLYILDPNEIGILGDFDKIPDTNSYVTLPFKVVSKVDTYFIVVGVLEKYESNRWVKVSEETNGIRTSRNIQGYWSVGKLSEGRYRYTLDAYNSDRTVSTKDTNSSLINEFEVVLSTVKSEQPVMTNLIAWFDANEKRNTDNDRNIWKNKEILGDTYRIELNGLNYVSNGWKHIDGLSDAEEGEFVLKFSGNSYGVMTKVFGGGVTNKYNPFSVLADSGQQGLTIETAFRTRCVGELNTRVLTCMENMNLNTPGVAITYDKLYLNSDKQLTSLDFMEEEWIHVAFVIDKNIRTFEMVGQDFIENLNDTYTMRIYINGVLCSCASFADDNFVDQAGHSFPLILNSTYDMTTGIFSNFGECEIKFIRVYNGYLTSEDVLQNYISHIFDLEKQKAMKDRNDVNIVSLPKIVFKRYEDAEKQGGNTKKFSNLHAITDKKTSKATCVPCLMEWHNLDGTIIQTEYVDVYLQGTSSLQYPVKNYQVKCYDSPASNPNRKKKKFRPPGKEDWPCDCYTYTMKVDFMEQSHNNNTPTAVFYGKVIDELTGGDKKKLSPAKRDGYLDAIDGIPCIAYYNDDPSLGEDVLIGSFMFNVHKDGDQLGFECDLYDDDDNVIGNGEDSCVSYEATANSSDTAGCFFTLEESINNVYKYQVEEWWKEYLSENNKTESECSKEEFQELIDNGSVDYMTFEEFKADYDVYDYIGSDFEPRFAYNEDDNEAMYRPMIDLVDWIASCHPNGILDKDKFKDEFDEHLSFEYCMAYFLQMMMFTQIDNCGKNAMFDTWDGKIFYPRPYDMDFKFSTKVDV